MHENTWNILYRGSLSSCNYACTYCPFAKTTNTREELAADSESLARFVSWVETQSHRRIGVLFTPWGEGLIRKYYRTFMAQLSHLPHVYRVAIQTNLSNKTFDWVEQCDRDKLALWTTYHPTQTSMSDFLQKCQTLVERGVRFSVGVVGFKDAFLQIEELRARLDDSVYLWINAYKREASYYTEEEIERLEAIDPLFRYNVHHHESLGAACQAGVRSFTVDERGDVRRCHFLPGVLGNIYETPSLETQLAPKPCHKRQCRCHIGYVHMEQLELYDVFGDGVLERIPEGVAWADEERARHLRQGAFRQIGPGPLPGVRIET